MSRARYVPDGYPMLGKEGCVTGTHGRTGGHLPAALRLLPGVVVDDERATDDVPNGVFLMRLP